MRIAVSPDKDEPAARRLLDDSRRRGPEAAPYGVPRPDRQDRENVAWLSRLDEGVSP